MKVLLIGIMATTFVLGMGFLSFLYLFGSVALSEARG